MIKCDVCRVNFDGKYKCPSCLIRYCSVPCYDKHKEKCKCNFNSKKDEQPNASSEGSAQQASRFSSGLIPSQQLESLRSEQPLLELLKNPHLRNLLKTINESENPEEIMQKAMQEPLFTEFADVCLNKLEPTSKDEQ